VSDATPEKSGEADASPSTGSATSSPPVAAQTQTAFGRMTKIVVPVLSVLLCLFTLFEVNYNRFQPQASLAVFVGFGLALCFLANPIHPKLAGNQMLRWLDVLLALAASGCCAYVFVQNEELFKSLWAEGRSLADRPGLETKTDFAIGLIGLILVFEATRRAIGLIVPLLAFFFVAHSYYCYGSQAYGWPEMPAWLLPHGGQSINDIVSTTYLQTLGVFGPAASVMFKYVFLFVVFGAFLEMSGATQFIIRFAERVFGRSPGGPAKVAVLGSGLMGSLSGSAVANAVTTGAFTIPMMRNAGFERHIAGGITAAAASGGALVPPVMGAGAYMMLELVQPQVTFLQVAKAALVPAILYYLSIFMIVHFYSKKVGAQAIQREDDRASLWEFEAVVFFGALGVLVGLLIWGFSPFKAVTGSLIIILFLSIFRKKLALGTAPRMLALAAFFGATLIHQFAFSETVDDPNLRQIVESWLGSTLVGTFGLLAFGLAHPAWRPAIMKALSSSARNGVSLVAASACVGIIIGIVQQTGIATDFSASIKCVVETNLFLALVGITICSIILGMGVPSVVCYLLMATLMGSLLSELGVIPLSAHLFIFYFGMMSMVTPPVALAAYASASIAEAPIMQTSFAAFRFSLVGFTLPFMFVYRPELTLQSDKPEVAIVSYRHTENQDPGSLRVSLKRFGNTVANSDVELRPVSAGETIALNSGDYGSISTKVAAGSKWDLFVSRGTDRWDEIGQIDIYAAPQDEASLTEIDKQNNRYAWGRFIDRRLSLGSTIWSTLAAVTGIIALAAGLAGFMRRNLGTPSRVLLFVSAALLLYPGSGIIVSGMWLPISDLAGLAVFTCVVAATWKLADTSSALS
jgi:TRAP transporter 4TM/12TM fusion protein